MKTNEQITELIKQRQFDGVRYACLERLKENRLDAQAWTSLGQAMIGKSRGKMSDLCFRRAVLLDPFVTWANDAFNHARQIAQGNDDKQVLKLLEVPNVTVSACILTRNSSRTIRQCIEAIRGAVDEIIVVDTGSTDDTISIVESLGLQVHHFEWCDDFAAARNYAQSLATKDWVITVDSDEILFPEDAQVVRYAASVYHESLIPVCVRIVQVNHLTSEDLNHFTGRMFRRDSGLEWVRKIHEQPSKVAHLQKTCAIRFHHDGYNGQEQHKKRSRRNMDILFKCLETEPNDPTYHFYLGREYWRNGELDEASKQVTIALDKLSDQPDQVSRKVMEETLEAIHLDINNQSSN